MLEQTPLWVKNLGTAVIGFFLVAVIAAWNIWLRNGGPVAVLYRIMGQKGTDEVYPMVPWLIPAAIALFTILIIAASSADDRWRKRNRLKAKRAA